MERKIFHAIGLMSGTSIDGVDAASIETDGYDHAVPQAFTPYAYDAAFRERLRSCFGRREGTANPAIASIERELTELHASAVKRFLSENHLQPESIGLIGFHGQTIWHQPEAKETVQLGDGALLAKLTGIPVVNDFRTADVLAGGNGAPLVPLYHRALAANLPKPAAIVNIGGVSNITWIGGDSDDDILAFDMGPGNALLDDWMLQRTGRPFDALGRLAADGTVDKNDVARFQRHPFFSAKPPKSLDRDAFNIHAPEHLNPADGAATLTFMTAWAIAQGLTFLPRPPRMIYLTGGGRFNATMMRWIGELSGIPVASVDDLGWSGDGLEAEAFAYLAVRSLLGLPLSLPSTTGVNAPMTGGRFHDPKSGSK
jgi:anhydro-N-acetylmuramic acid kinase